MLREPAPHAGSVAPDVENLLGMYEGLIRPAVQAAQLAAGVVVVVVDVRDLQRPDVSVRTLEETNVLVAPMGRRVRPVSCGTTIAPWPPMGSRLLCGHGARGRPVVNEGTVEPPAYDAERGPVLTDMVPGHVGFPPEKGGASGGGGTWGHWQVAVAVHRSGTVARC